MAKELGFDTVANSYFTTPFQKAEWEKITSEKRKNRQERQEPTSQMGAVGAVVLDNKGFLAAGESTGGPSGKSNWRTGDTTKFGTGLFADNKLSVVW